MKLGTVEMYDCLVTTMDDVCDELKRSGNPDDYNLGRWLQEKTDITCEYAVEDAMAPIRVDKMEYGDSYIELSYRARGWYNQLENLVSDIANARRRISKKEVMSVIKDIMTDINNYV